MGHACAAAMLAGLLCVSAPPTLPDLSKVDRTIAKEPTYRTTPRHCLLVLGPKADSRVWLVRDGEKLYVDRNANGDLTEPGESLQPGAGASSGRLRMERPFLTVRSLTLWASFPRRAGPRSTPHWSSLNFKSGTSRPKSSCRFS